MASDLIREKTDAQGGVTPAERERIDDQLRLWTGRAMRTAPLDPGKIIPAVEGIYAAAGLERPRIAFAASPLALAFAYGAAAAICYARNQQRSGSEPHDSVGITLSSAGKIELRRGKNIRKAVEAVTHKAEAALNKLGQINDLAEYETHIALGSTLRTISGRNYYTASPLYQEISDCFGFRWRGSSLGSPSAEAANTASRRRILVRNARKVRAAFGLTTIGKAVNDAVLAAVGDISPAVADRILAHEPNPDKSAAIQANVSEIEILAAQACHAIAGRVGLLAAKHWERASEGRAWQFSQVACLAAFRDVLGLELPCHSDFENSEQATVEGGLRVMHEEFCIVCDFPEVLKFDEQGRPHCADGPSHRWRDGWALYRWHGTPVPKAWIEDKASLTPAFALTVPNTELRRAALEIVGWHNVLRELNCRVVAEDPDPQHGRLIDVNLPGFDRPSRFLHVQCATGREFAVGIPSRFRTVKGAHAWLTGLPTRKFKFPSVRT